MINLEIPRCWLRQHLGRPKDFNQRADEFCAALSEELGDGWMVSHSSVIFTEHVNGRPIQSLDEEARALVEKALENVGV